MTLETVDSGSPRADSPPPAPTPKRTLELFRCERYGTRLMRAACGARWRLVNVDRGSRGALALATQQARFGMRDCIGCPVGREHARGGRTGEDVATPTIVSTPRLVDRGTEATMDKTSKKCAECGGQFAPTDGRQRRCPKCRAKDAPSRGTEQRKSEPAQAAQPAVHYSDKPVFDEYDAQARREEIARAQNGATTSPVKPKTAVPTRGPDLSFLAPDPAAKKPANILRALGYDVTLEEYVGNRVLVVIEVPR